LRWVLQMFAIIVICLLKSRSYRIIVSPECLPNFSWC